MVQPTESTHQVRWVVLGPVTPTPTGRRFSLDRGSFNEWLEKQAIRCVGSVPNSLGSGTPLRLDVAVDKLRVLTLKEVTSTVPELRDLLALAGTVGDGPAAIAAVERIVGAGPLSAKIAEIEGSATGQTGTGPAKAATPGATGTGEIFDQAGMPKKQSAASAAVDAFLRAGPAGGAKPRKSKSSRQVRDAIEEAVFTAARALLAAPEVSAVERTLRGVQLLVGQCPQKSGISVDVLDVPLDSVTEELRGWRRGDLVDEPDAVFVPFPITDLRVARELAEIGEELLCPVVIDVPPSVFGHGDVDSLVVALGSLQPKDAEPGWLALRQEESSRWLCAVANGVVLAAEGVGAAQRTLIGSGVWALAATMSKCYAEVGSFARITGRPGAITAPGTRTISSGFYEGMAAPTEAFIPISGQADLAKHGLLALGSSRNSDLVVLAATPMVRGSADAVPLPAQLLTGRIVRFARWVRDQLPPQADAKTVNEVFEAASKVFLFPGMQDVGYVRADLREEDGKSIIFVQAKVHPAHAGIPFEIGFPLPLTLSED
jgi:hypothetical protein